MVDQAYQLRQIVAQLKENRQRRQKQKTRIITVTSGKGGVGKTTFAVNFALSLSAKGFRVLVVDADFGLANVNIVTGVPVAYNLLHVFSREKTIREVIVDCPGGIKFISGGSGLGKLVELGEDELESCIGQLMELEDIADIILIDTGAGINDNILKFIVSSNEAIVVTTPEPTSLMDAYALVKTAAKISKNIQFRLVVNMARSAREAQDTAANFNMLTNNYLGVKVDELGYLLYDKTVTEAIRLQKPFYSSFPKCMVSKNMQNIVMKFIGQPTESFYSNNLQKFIRRFLQITS